MMEKQKKTFRLTVRKQPLRNRNQEQRYTCKEMCYHSVHTSMKREASTNMNTPQQISPRKCTQHASQTGLQSQINWIKYNILIGIYQNWLRLQPYVTYWLSKNLQITKQKEQISTKQYLKKGEASTLLLKENQKSLQKFNEIMKNNNIYEFIRKRKEKIVQLLKQQKNIQIQEDILNLDQIKNIHNDLITNIPVLSKEDKIFQKIKARRLDSLINDEKFLDEAKLDPTGDALILAIKQRLKFINKVQQKFKFYHQSQKQMLLKQLQALEKSMNIMSCMNSLKKQMENQYKNILSQLYENKQDLYAKRPFLKARSGFISKMKSKNDLQKDLKSHSPEQKPLAVKKKATFNLLKNRLDKTHKNNSISQAKRQSKISVKSADSFFEDDKTNDIQVQIPREFLQKVPKSLVKERKKAKIQKDQKLSIFSDSNQQKYHKFKSDSFSQNKRTSIKLESNAFDSINDESSQKNINQGEFDGNQEEKQLFLNGAKTNKSIATFKSMKKQKTIFHPKNSKNNNGSIRYQSTSNDYNVIVKVPLKAKNPKKRTFNGRRGLCGKLSQKHNCTSTIDLIDNMDFTHLKTRQQFIDYFKFLLQKGKLDKQIHSGLKQAVKDLIDKYSPNKIQENHEFVQKIVKKSIFQLDNFQIKQSETYENERKIVLQGFRKVLENDDKIKKKVRDQMKIYDIQNFSLMKFTQQDRNKQQILMNKNTLVQKDKQFRRLNDFLNEEKLISFGRKLMKINNVLIQQGY